MAPAAASQNLPTKEQSAFRTVVKLHEQKQYKKALKSADSILQKFANHGETLAMKGLVLNSMNRKEEAYEFAKLGLRNNIKSSVCWHVYGLIYRSDRNYAEAIKCYRNALRIKDASGQILRDLSILQIQTRDLEGYSATCRELLMKQSNLRKHWVGFSISHLLRGSSNMAIAIIDQWIATIDKSNSATKSRYEDSELLMYKALLLEKSGKIEETIVYLDENKDDIVDKVAWREKKAGLLLGLGRFEEAKAIYLEMIDINPESYDAHRGLQACILETNQVSHIKGCELPVNTIECSPEQREQLKQLYDNYYENYPRAFAFKRIPLDFLDGEDFTGKADVLFRVALRKGIPSLFSSFRPMYKIAFNRGSESVLYSGANAPAPVSEAKRSSALKRVNALGDLVEGYLKCLEQNQSFGPSSDEKELPTVTLWCMFYLAQHYDMAGKLDDALVMIDKAIEHTPTLVDLYQIKGRILKHCGAFDAAADALEEGRKLDLADKWINSKSAKFQLRAGRITEGESVVSLFTKHEGDSHGYLMDMQCSWYEIEAGNAHLLNGQLPMALKFFKNVEKHFDDYEEDQFDFHGYCLRKMTLRSYLDILELEERLRAHPFFCRAVNGAVQCYLRMHDLPSLYKKEEEEVVDFSKLSGAERKRAKAKAKKLEQKKNKEAEQKRLEEEQARKNDKDKDGNPKKRLLPVDEDPRGEKFFNKVVGAPLDEANRVLGILLKYAPKNLQTHLNCFDVQIRRGKYLQAFKALYAACSLADGGSEHPEVFSRLIPFLHFVQTKKITYAPWAGKSTSAEDINKPVDVVLEVSDAARKVVELLTVDLIGNAKPKEVAEKYLKYAEASTDIARRVAACKTLFLINTDAKSAPWNVVVVPKGSDFECLRRAHGFLTSFGAPPSEIDRFVKQGREVYPRASVFATAKEE